jgi:LysM repeat protein
MKSAAIYLSMFVIAALFASAQTFTSAPAKSSETAQLQALTKKIEEQNAKIDILSQQILKLEQQISHMRPGIMIGESEASPTKPAVTATPAPRAANGITTHTVARGETLTSIAKLYGIGVGELQRFNHIEDPLKLRAGQTLMIPPSPTPAASTPSE